MKGFKKLLSSPRFTVVALVLAAALLGFSTVGGANAALTYYSDNYVSTVRLSEIGIQLVENGAVVAENGEAVSGRGADGQGALLGALYVGSSTTPVPESEPFRTGVRYREELCVRNPVDESGEVGNITEYVRVTIRRYWMAENERGELVKSSALGGELDPSLILLELTEGNGWIRDDEASTDERTVLYYSRPLAAGEQTAPFATSFMISPEAATAARSETSGGRTFTTFIYNNASFRLEVTADAVQQSSGQDAIKSAWGREVEISSDGTLSLR